MAFVYLIRHGQTKWNKEEIFRGQADIPLNDFGRSQAKALARALKKKGLENPLFTTSPLQRASETAAIIASHLGDSNVTKDPAYLDISYGKWEGKSLVEIRQEYPDLYRSWLEKPEKVIFPGGENLKAAADRAEKGLYEAARGNPDRHIIIVAHRAINKVLLCRLLGLGEQGFWKIRQDTACLNELHLGNQGFFLVKLNDTCHLDSMSGDTKDF